MTNESTVPIEAMEALGERAKPLLDQLPLTELPYAFHKKNYTRRKEIFETMKRPEGMSKTAFAQRCARTWNYLEYLCSQFHIPLAEIPLNDFLIRDGIFVVNDHKSHLNRKMYEFMEERNKVVEEVFSEIQLRKINEALKGFKDHETKRLQLDLNTYKSQADSHMSRAESCLRNAREVQHRIENFTSERASRLEQNIKSLNENPVPGWEYKGLDRIGSGYDGKPELKLTFVRKTPVVLNHVVPEQNVDITVNLGYFRAEYYYMRGRWQILDYKENTTVGGHSHPHLRGDGSACWGQLKSEYIHARTTGDLRKLLLITTNLLEGYNDISPYVSLTSFLYAQGGTANNSGGQNEQENSEGGQDPEEEEDNYPEDEPEDERYDVGF